MPTVPASLPLRSLAASASVAFALTACAGQAGPPAQLATSSRAMEASSDHGGGDVATPAAAEAYTPYVAPPSGGDSVVLSGPTPAPPPDERPGLATAWGESIWSPITTQPFVRASSQPWAAAVLHYNDAGGVRAHADYLGASIAPLEAWVGDGALGVSLVDERGGRLAGIAAAGRHLVAGNDGERYQIVVRNATTARFEIVASVDGLDVIDGKPAGIDRRGYLVDPGAELVIDGFRRSDDQVAAFRFGKVAASYAARTSGDANVGVIGIAVFAERGAVWSRGELERRDRANPFPARGYAAAP